MSQPCSLVALSFWLLSAPGPQLVMYHTECTEVSCGMGPFSFFFQAWKGEQDCWITTRWEMSTDLSFQATAVHVVLVLEAEEVSQVFIKPAMASLTNWDPEC